MKRIFGCYPQRIYLTEGKFLQKRKDFDQAFAAFMEVLQDYVLSAHFLEEGRIG